MGIFGKAFKFWTKSKDPSSPRYRRDMAQRLNGKHIKYVTENRDGVDEVVGRNGGINIRDDELIVFASADIVFRAKIVELSAWELMSHDGVVLTAPDLEHGGAERTVIAHYTYYRK